MADKGIIFSAPMVRALLDGRKTQTRRLLKPQPADTMAAGKRIDHVGDYCTGAPHHGMAYYWRENGCWNSSERFRLPYAIGDRLYVREAFRAEELARPPQNRLATRRERQITGRTSLIVCDDIDGADGVRYLADDTWARIENTPAAGDAWSELFYYGQKDGTRPVGLCGKGVPSIHMPRWASRLMLSVSDVRVERLQAISEADAEAEGFPGGRDCELAPSEWYSGLWNMLHTQPGARWADDPWVVAVTFDVRHGNIDQVPA